MKSEVNHNDADSGSSVDLASFLDAQSLFVVGASSDATKQSDRSLYYLSRYGYTGEVFVVDVAHDELFGFPSYNSVEALPITTELAHLLLPKAKVVGGIDGLRSALTGERIPCVSGSPAGGASLLAEHVHRHLDSPNSVPHGSHVEQRSDR